MEEFYKIKLKFDFFIICRKKICNLKKIPLEIILKLIFSCKQADKVELFRSKIVPRDESENSQLVSFKNLTRIRVI